MIQEIQGRFGLFVLCVSFLMPSIATAKKENVIHTVRYSYEKQTRTGQKRYVLIPKTTQISKKDYANFKARQKSLFNTIKSDKKSNYGETKFNVKDEVVFIFLDEKKSRNHPFIMAEAIYTFTENGASHVEFPRSQYKGRKYTRRDVKFPAYQITLPYWEGLPPHELKSGLLSFSDGSLVTPKALKERLKSNEKTLTSQMNQTLKSANISAVRAIVQANEISLVKGLEEGLLSLLKSANTDLRMLALRGLKGRDSKEVNVAVRKVMDGDPDESIKDEAAQVLSQSTDSNFSEAAQFRALLNKDPSIVIKTASMLTKAKSKEVTKQLIKTLSRGESGVRAAIITALMKRKAQPQLLQVLKGEQSVDVKVMVAQALTSHKKSKDQAYTFLVTQPQSQAAATAAKELGGDKKNKRALDLLAKALTHPDAEARIAAAKALVQQGGKRSLEILAKGNLKDPESGVELHNAMREIYAAQKDNLILTDAARRKQVSLKSAAAGTLGVIFKRSKLKYRVKAFKAAVQLAQSTEPWIRAEVARSLGDMGTSRAQTELLKLTQDKSIEVHRMVAFALRHFPEEAGRPFLTESLKSKDIPLLINTLDSLGVLQSIPSLNSLLSNEFLEHKDAKIRRATTGALATIAPVLEKKHQSKVTPRLDLRLSKEKDLEVRLRAVRGLGAIPSSDSNFSLTQNLQTGERELTFAIIKALTTHNIADSAQSLKIAMENKDVLIRKAAYESVSTFTNAEAKLQLKDLLKKRLKLEQDEALKVLLNTQLKAL